MKSNAIDAMAKPSDVNHLSCLRYILSTSRVISCSFPKYFELVEIAMVQVANPSCIIDSLPTQVWWSECFPINFTPYIIFHMQKHLRNGKHNILDMVWELRFEVLWFQLNNFLVELQAIIVGWNFWSFLVSEVTNLNGYHFLFSSCRFYILF